MAEDRRRLFDKAIFNENLQGMSAKTVKVKSVKKIAKKIAKRMKKERDVS